MSYKSLESMIRNVVSESMLDEAALGDHRGLTALAKRKTGDEKNVMMRAADMMKKGQVKDLNMFMKAMDQSTHKAIMPFVDKKHHKALHEDIEELDEKKLTPAELKKREEIAQAIERENPDMPMPQKMAIATAQAKKVAENKEEQVLDFIQSLSEEVKIEEDSSYKTGSKKDPKGGHRALITSPQGGMTYLGGTSYKTAKHAKGEADAWHNAYFNTPGMRSKGNPRGAERAAHDYSRKNAHHVHEGLDETKGAPKGYHFTRSGQLKKGDAGQDGPGGAMLRSDPLDKQRKKIPPLPETAEPTADKSARARLDHSLRAQGHRVQKPKKGKGSYDRKAMRSTRMEEVEHLNEASYTMHGEFPHKDGGWVRLLKRSNMDPQEKNKKIWRVDHHNERVVGMDRNRIVKTSNKSKTHVHGSYEGHAKRVYNELKKKHAMSHSDAKKHYPQYDHSQWHKGPVKESREDQGKPEVHTRKSDFKLTKVTLPDGRMAWRKVKKEVDVEK